MRLGKALETVVSDLELYKKYCRKADRAVHLFLHWKLRSQAFSKIVSGVEVSGRVR